MIFLWGGGQQLERVSFLLKKPAAASPCTASLVLAKNGDYCGESAVTHAQVRAFDSPCKAPFLAQKSFREQTSLESTFQKVDSSTAANVSEPQQKDSRILELESGFFEPRKEIRLERLSTKCGDEIHDSSPKAESIVVAIDSIYTTLTPTTHHPNITLESSLDSALAHYAFDLFFASDVLHHLSPDFTQKLLESIAHIPTIIIKDIDSRHIVGHYANALHDLVFNQEKVCKVYPNKLESTLQALGYTTRYHYLPKLWYPHFLLLAYKAAT